MDSSTESCLGCAFIAVTLIIAAGVNLFGAWMEKTAFNDCTGGNASIYTALFTELRVEDCKR